MAERQIAFLWAPYFGATVAQRAEPRLAGRPLVLLDEGGWVLAVDGRSARAGVAPGLSERQAAARCPDAALLPAARFPLAEAQARFLERVRGYADRWQADGLGRVYLDATGLGHAGADAAAAGPPRELLGWCQALAAAVRDLGWRPALGTAGSKFAAGVAGQAAWQDAALVLAPVALRAFLSGQPVATLPLDADALVQLRHLGIRTLGQFARLPAAGVLTRFGQAGLTAQRWAQGADDRPVIPPWEEPEVSARIEFDPPLEDQERLLAALVRRTERLLEPLRGQFLAAGRVLLSVVCEDGRTLPAAHVFPLPTSAAGPVRLALAAVLAKLDWGRAAAAEASVTLAGITDVPGRQLALFDAADSSRAQLVRTLERLEDRFGAEAFRLAVLVDPGNPLPERRVSWRRFDR